MEEEFFVDIEGYEGKYQISNYGNVMSLNYNNTHKPKILKPKINKLGFAEIKLSKDNKTKDYMIANLVAKHFLPTNKRCNKVINEDGNKLNNYYKNLKWVYDTEQRHIMYNRGNRQYKGKGNKLSYKRKGYKSYKELANKYNITSNNFINRLHKGWSLEETVEIKVDKNNVSIFNSNYYEYYGQILSTKEICKINNIKEKEFLNRLYKGWNVYEAAEIKGIERK